MCGIAGYFGKGNKEIINRMARTLRYRGPDDFGVFADELAGLGHTRLSIIDLSARAHQPMSNSSRTVWIAFNGEIYNFKELRKKLIKEGYKFKSASDTEVIIYLYEQYGERVFSMLDGMFALAIYDQRRKRIILYRDIENVCSSDPASGKTLIVGLKITDDISSMKSSLIVSSTRIIVDASSKSERTSTLFLDPAEDKTTESVIERER